MKNKNGKWIKARKPRYVELLQAHNDAIDEIRRLERRVNSLEKKEYTSA